jgi:hypothetical protein
MNAEAATFLPSNDFPVAPEKHNVAAAGRPPKVKSKPESAVPQSLSAMNLAMTLEEEAIARDVSSALHPECSTSERMAFAGKVGNAVKDGVSP